MRHVMTFFKSNYFHSFHERESHRGCSWKLPLRLRRIDSRQNWEENTTLFYDPLKLTFFYKSFIKWLSCNKFFSSSGNAMHNE